MRRRSCSIFSIFTVSFCPSSSTSRGWLILRPSPSFEMCTRPSIPSSRVTKAPKGANRATVPLCVEPSLYTAPTFAQGSAMTARRLKVKRSFSQSRLLIATSTTWSMLSTSDIFSTLPHPVSEIGRSPSIPPMSMKAPKSRMFVTVPLTIIPSLRVPFNSSRLVRRSSSTIARCETMMLRPFSPNRVILKARVCPTDSPVSSPRRRPS